VTTTTLAVTDWIQIGNGLGSDLKSLMLVVIIPLLAALFVVVVGFKTKAAGPTIMACVLGGIVIGLSLSMSVLGSVTSQTITHYDKGGTHFSGADQ
jgi:hypothetical protein